MKLKKVAIHGVPRSGTTWLGAIFDSSPSTIYRNQPLFSYAFKSFLSEDSSTLEIQDFFDKIAVSDDPFINQIKGKHSGIIPTFKKEEPTHIVYKEARYHHILRNLLQKDRELIVVGIVRDPISVLLSWKNAPKEFDSNQWDFKEEWYDAPKKNLGKKEEFYGYKAWKSVATEFIELKKIYDDRFYIISYEKLVENTLMEVNNLFEFSGLPFTVQTLNFLKESTSINQNGEPYSVYRKKVFNPKEKERIEKSILEYIESDLNSSSLKHFLKQEI